MSDKITNETLEVMRDKIIRAAIYVRVSTEKQEKEGYSLDSQIKECLDYCKKHGYRVAPEHIYREVMSAVVYRERKQLNELRAAARRREFDRLVVYDLDRLAREDTHQTVIMEDLAFNGVRAEAVRVNLEDTPAGRFMLHAYGFMAAVEREKILERMERGKRQRARNGQLLGQGNASFGYQWNEDRTCYVIAPQNAEIVRYIFESIANGASIRSLAAELTEKGIPTPKGRPYWSTATISDMLNNPHYIGKAIAFKEQHTRSPEGKHTIRTRPEEEQILLPEGTVPAIISIETWEKVQEQLEYNKRNASRNGPGVPTALLRCGLAVCGYCGCSVMTHRIDRGGYEEAYYQCGQPRTRLNKCPGFNIRVHIMDAIVWEYVAEIIRRPELVELALAEQRENSNLEEELAPIESSLTKVERKMKNYKRVIDTAEDDAVLDDAIAELDKLAKEMHALEKEKLAIMHQQANLADEQAEIEEFKQWCIDVREKLSDPNYESTYQEKRRACERLKIKVTLWKKDHDPRHEIVCKPLASCVHSMKIEHARFFGGLSTVGINTGVILGRKL
jgi:site-specific DNA recombinase